MKLHDYLKSKGIAPYKFAKEAGLGYGTVYDIVNGKRLELNARTISKINLATDGEVGIFDLLPHLKEAI